MIKTVKQKAIFPFTLSPSSIFCSYMHSLLLFFECPSTVYKVSMYKSPASFHMGCHILCPFPYWNCTVNMNDPTLCLYPLCVSSQTTNYWHFLGWVQGSWGLDCVEQSIIVNFFQEVACLFPHSTDVYQ
jgi:hypothetical protein